MTMKVKGGCVLVFRIVLRYRIKNTSLSVRFRSDGKVGLVFRFCNGSCLAPCNIGLAALGTYARFQRNGLGDYLPAFSFGFCLIAVNVLHLVTADCRRSSFGSYFRGGLEGNSGIVGAVPVFAVLAGLTFAVFFPELLEPAFKVAYPPVESGYFV